MLKSHSTLTWYRLVSQFLKIFPGLLFVLLCAMFPLGYFESFRWHLPPPKATHGILKGLLLLGGAVVFLGTRLRIRIKENRDELLVTGLFLLSFIISSVFSIAPDTSLLFLWYPLIGYFYVWAFQHIRLSEKRLAILAGISVLLIMTTFIFAVFSIFSRYEVDNVYYFLFLDHRANYFLEEIRRAGKYVSLGPYFMLMPLASVFLVYQTAPRIRKIVSAVAVCVSVLTAVISNNRIDVLVIAIQLGILIWFIPRRLAIIVLLIAIPITQLGLSITEQYFGFNLEERILRPQYERDTETIDMRYTYWQTALYNFRQNPVFGTGPNTYNEVSDFPLRRYYDRGVFQYTVRPDEGIGVHNLFIERLADTGIIGFLAFIAVLIYYARFDISSLLRKQGPDRSRYALYSLSSWSWILYGITDNGYGAQGFVTFFFLRGILSHL